MRTWNDPEKNDSFYLEKPNRVPRNGDHMLTWASLWRGTAATNAQVIMKKTKRFIVFEKWIKHSVSYMMKVWFTKAFTTLYAFISARSPIPGAFIFHTDPLSQQLSLLFSCRASNFFHTHFWVWNDWELYFDTNSVITPNCEQKSLSYECTRNSRNQTPRSHC